MAARLTATPHGACSRLRPSGLMSLCPKPRSHPYALEVGLAPSRPLLHPQTFLCCVKHLQLRAFLICISWWSTRLQAPIQFLEFNQGIH